MPRFAAEVSYLGGAFSGFQRQPGRSTVQQTLEEALAMLNGGEPTPCTGCGRTDAGVHARGQVVHFDLPRPWDPWRLRGALAAHLPSSLEILRVAAAPPAFHARFDAIWREYRFFLWNRGTCLPHLRPFVWWVKHPVDWEPAAALLPRLEGYRDFGAFCRAADRPEDSHRTLLHASCRSRGGLVRFRFRADGFLTNMIRILLGTLLRVASGETSSEQVLALLEGGRREDAGRTAPAQGLFFWRAGYEPSLWNSASSGDGVQ